MAAQDSGKNRILKLEELSHIEIDKLDRNKSAFILTFGNLEEHGPHLPVGTDYFEAIVVRDAMVSRLLRSRPDYTFVLVPVVPLGEGGANDNMLELDHIGTFAVRYDTLRNVAVDLGSSIIRKGFRHVLLIHDHGAPLHNAAFNEAAAFVNDRRGCCMVNITSIVLADELSFFRSTVYRKYFGEQWKQKVGFDPHGGAGETAMSLAIRPDLVKSDYKNYPPFLVEDQDEFFRSVQHKREWRGYWGSPALATPQMGQDFLDDLVSRTTKIAEMVLADQDLSKLPVYPDVLGPAPDAANVFIKAVMERYNRDAAELDAWLKERNSTH
jgi:creatinine amidohydrolase/Fe(II)-dependent formamide hydrolase-like protein